MGVTLRAKDVPSFGHLDTCFPGHCPGPGHKLLPRWLGPDPGPHRGQYQLHPPGGLEERVTKKDAELICGGHDGWLVEIQAEHNGAHGNHKNRDIVKLISAKQGQNNIGTPGYNFQDQWWIGATCQGPHGDHNQGHWTWDHCGSDVQWFDFYDNEPNNWHSQNCLTFLKDQDIFGFGVYNWNDWGCDYVARYICEKAPMQRSTKPDQSPPSAKYRHLRRLWR